MPSRPLERMNAWSCCLQLCDVVRLINWCYDYFARKIPLPAYNGIVCIAGREKEITFGSAPYSSFLSLWTGQNKTEDTTHTLSSLHSMKCLQI